MKWLLCTWLGIHRAPVGVDPAFCVAFRCERCRNLVPGARAKKRRT